MRSDTDTGETVRFRADDAEVEGDLLLPAGGDTIGVVAFAHGSGSSRFSSRNRFVADRLRERGLATLLIDLLTAEEEQVDLRTRELRFDIPLLGRRVIAACDWLVEHEETRKLPIGLFGASTGAAAALIAAAERPDAVGAVVSRGGRPDLARDHLPRVRQPVLLIVGGADEPVIGMNRDAASQMTGTAPRIEIVPAAGHLFEEPGKLGVVAELAGEFFRASLGRASAQ